MPTYKNVEESCDDKGNSVEKPEIRKESFFNLKKHSPAMEVEVIKCSIPLTVKLITYVYNQSSLQAKALSILSFGTRRLIVQDIIEIFDLMRHINANL
jgi:hypothetical protein